MTNRVIVWGTGFVGSAVLRVLLAHPAYEVVGVIVNDPAKDGKDAGELAGASPVGLRASRDAARVLAEPADAVAYFGPSAIHAEANLQNLSVALRAGKNVVDTAMGALQDPRRAPEAMRRPIEEACAAGGVSFFSTGIDPGFANDLFPLTLLGVCGRVDSIRTTEFLDAGTYPDQASMQMLGLQTPLEEKPTLDTPGLMTTIWGTPLFAIAEALGVEVEDTREVYQRWPAPAPLDFPLGRVEKGCAAAHRIELQGIVRGEPRIIIDHVHRLVPEAAPDWPRPASDPAHANRVEVRGDPNIVQETVIVDAHTGDGNAGGCLATGMRAVHAIPAVCAAPPGIVSLLDLPLISGRGGMG